jgi:hypothetical protein
MVDVGRHVLEAHLARAAAHHHARAAHDAHRTRPEPSGATPDTIASQRPNLGPSEDAAQ